VKRFVGIAVVALMLTAMTETASAQRGAPGVKLKENDSRLKVNGPGFRVKLTKHGIDTRIDDAEFGIPEAGFPIVRTANAIPVAATNNRPFTCANGTYRFTAPATFTVTQRATGVGPRPLPYTPAFNNSPSFRNLVTFVGTVDTIVQNAAGEQFRLLMTDIAHEVMTETSFSSTAPIHAYIVDANGRVRDYASLTGLVNIDRTTGEARHKIINRGTCNQQFNLNLGPGTDQSTIFGPFFVLPFNTTVVTLDDDDSDDDDSDSDSD
jgi:hypothetical protein